MGLGIGTFANAVCTPLQNGAVVATPGPTAQLSGGNFTANFASDPDIHFPTVIPEACSDSVALAQITN
jgi:hypothetical protein